VFGCKNETTFFPFNIKNHYGILFNVCDFCEFGSFGSWLKGLEGCACRMNGYDPISLQELVGNNTDGNPIR